MFKYLLNYLLPCKYAYKLLYDELPIDIRFIGGSTPNGISDIVVTDISYDEYKKMDKETKLYYFDSYVKQHRILIYFILGILITLAISIFK